jgi:hypothetical protein
MKLGIAASRSLSAAGFPHLSPHEGYSKIELVVGQMLYHFFVLLCIMFTQRITLHISRGQIRHRKEPMRFHVRAQRHEQSTE